MLSKTYHVGLLPLVLALLFEFSLFDTNTIGFSEKYDINNSESVYSNEEEIIDDHITEEEIESIIRDIRFVTFDPAFAQFKASDDKDVSEIVDHFNSVKNSKLVITAAAGNPGFSGLDILIRSIESFGISKKQLEIRFRDQLQDETDYILKLHIEPHLQSDD